MEHTPKPKQTPSFTKPMRKLGDERVRPGSEKADYEGGYLRPKNTPFMGKPQGGYDNVGSEAKVTKGDGKERVRNEKVDYAGKFSRPNETPFMGKPQGGYDHVGNKAKGTPSEGKERVRPQGEKANYEKDYIKPAKKVSPFGKNDMKGGEDTKKM